MTPAAVLAEAVQPDPLAHSPQLIYTPWQASRRLGVDERGEPIRSPRWLLDEARAGRISYTRVGKAICFSERNLLELVEKGYVLAPNARAA